jgi:hypothetical protein
MRHGWRARFAGAAILALLAAGAPGSTTAAPGDGWSNANGTSTSASGQASTGSGQPALVFAFDVGQTVTGCSSSQGPCSVAQPDGATSFEVFATTATVTLHFQVVTAQPIACDFSVGFKVSFNGNLPYTTQDPVPRGNTCTTPPPPTSCPVTNVKGRLQPVQAVWQDDEIFRAKKADNNQLIGRSPSETAALLQMVQDKPTALFGVEKVRNEATKSGIHDQITIEGDTSGTTDVDVKMQFGSANTSPSTIETTENLGTIKLDGPCGPPQHFVISLPFSDGVPRTGPGFTFPDPGPYTISDELLRATGEPTGIGISVSGTVVRTSAPSIVIVPMLLSSATPHDLEYLASKAGIDETEVRDRVPDMFPLVPLGIETSVHSTLDFTRVRVTAARNYETWLKSHKFSASALVDARTDSLLAAISSFFGLGPGQAAGAQRIVVLLRDKDFDLLRGKNAAAFTANQKVIFVRAIEDWDTIAHELVHTLPFIWSSDQMKRMCNYDYHNLSKRPVAAGESLTMAGAPQRMNRDGFVSLMESDGIPSTTWIDQCTYRNLVQVLQKPPDPPALLVQGRLARTGSRIVGQLFPLYTFQGATDLTAGGSGSYAIVLRSSTGAQLARFGFTPAWNLPDPDEARNVLSFLYRVPFVAGTARVDLVGPGNSLLGGWQFSKHAPTVRITSPPSGGTPALTNGRLHVTWAGSDADHAPLVYSIVYSADNGASWIALATDVSANSLDVAPQPGSHTHLVRVYVSDGGRSAMAQLRFTTP